MTHAHTNTVSNTPAPRKTHPERARDRDLNFESVVIKFEFQTDFRHTPDDGPGTGSF